VSSYDVVVDGSVELIGSPLRFTTYVLAFDDALHVTCTPGAEGLPFVQNGVADAEKPPGSGGCAVHELAAVPLAPVDSVEPPPFVAVTV
jgi:hypothetical protein